MTYINQYCADVGTANCPCPLAETGDCLICSRLCGRETCDCMWAGLCIYNEYIQNDKVVRNPRIDIPAKVLKKTWYEDDLMTLTLEVPRGMALNAASPGSFVFLRTEDADAFTNVPVSVMASDVEKSRLHLAVKILSGKTKRIAEAEDCLMLRGIYRNGILGEGLKGLGENVKGEKWLIMTKGVGFAPAINLLKWANGRVDVQMVTDTEKISRAMIDDCFYEHMDRRNLPTKIIAEHLQDIKGHADRYDVKQFDRVFIMASDYYIRTISNDLDIPAHKLIFSNNFHMCCGEGICGACGHTDSQGNFSKMCKCRNCVIQ